MLNELFPIERKLHQKGNRLAPPIKLGYGFTEDELARILAAAIERLKQTRYFKSVHPDFPAPEQERMTNNNPNWSVMRVFYGGKKLYFLVTRRENEEKLDPADRSQFKPALFQANTENYFFAFFEYLPSKVASLVGLPGFRVRVSFSPSETQPNLPEKFIPLTAKGFQGTFSNPRKHARFLRQKLQGLRAPQAVLENKGIQVWIFRIKQGRRWAWVADEKDVVLLAGVLEADMTLERTRRIIREIGEMATQHGEGVWRRGGKVIPPIPPAKEGKKTSWDMRLQRLETHWKYQWLSPFVYGLQIGKLFPADERMYQALLPIFRAGELEPKVAERLAQTLVRMQTGSLDILYQLGVLTREEQIIFRTGRVRDLKKMSQKRKNEFVGRLTAVVNAYRRGLPRSQRMRMMKRLVPVEAIELLAKKYRISKSKMIVIILAHPDFPVWLERHPRTPSLTANLFSGKGAWLNWLVRLPLAGAIVPHELGHWLEGKLAGRAPTETVRWRHFFSAMPWQTRGPPALAGYAMNFLMIALGVLAFPWTSLPTLDFFWIYLIYANSILLIVEAAASFFTKENDWKQLFANRSKRISRLGRVTVAIALTLPGGTAILQRFLSPPDQLTVWIPETKHFQIQNRLVGAAERAIQNIEEKHYFPDSPLTEALVARLRSFARNPHIKYFRDDRKILVTNRYNYLIFTSDYFIFVNLADIDKLTDEELEVILIHEMTHTLPNQEALKQLGAQLQPILKEEAAAFLRRDTLGEQNRRAFKQFLATAGQIEYQAYLMTLLYDGALARSKGMTLRSYLAECMQNQTSPLRGTNSFLHMIISLQNLIDAEQLAVFCCLSGREVEEEHYHQIQRVAAFELGIEVEQLTDDQLRGWLVGFLFDPQFLEPATTLEGAFGVDPLQWQSEGVSGQVRGPVAAWPFLPMNYVEEYLHWFVAHVIFGFPAGRPVVTREEAYVEVPFVAGRPRDWRTAVVAGVGPAFWLAGIFIGAGVLLSTIGNIGIWFYIGYAFTFILFVPSFVMLFLHMAVAFKPNSDLYRVLFYLQERLHLPFHLEPPDDDELCPSFTQENDRSHRAYEMKEILEYCLVFAPDELFKRFNQCGLKLTTPSEGDLREENPEIFYNRVVLFGVYEDLREMILNLDFSLITIEEPWLRQRILRLQKKLLKEKKREEKNQALAREMEKKSAAKPRNPSPENSPGQPAPIAVSLDKIDEARRRDSLVERSI